jgi:hypothetical protein
MSRLAVGVRRLAFRHQHRHFYSNENSRRDESSAILAVANPEQASTEIRLRGRMMAGGPTEESAKRRTPNAKRSRPYFTSFKRSA